MDLEALFWGEPCSFCGGLGGVFCGVVSSVGGFSDFLVGSSKPFFFGVYGLVVLFCLRFLDLKADLVSRRRRCSRRARDTFPGIAVGEETDSSAGRCGWKR